jgi:hypothetical protein
VDRRDREHLLSQGRIADAERVDGRELERFGLRADAAPGARSGRGESDLLGDVGVDDVRAAGVEQEANGPLPSIVTFSATWLSTSSNGIVVVPPGSDASFACGAGRRSAAAAPGSFTSARVPRTRSVRIPASALTPSAARDAARIVPTSPPAAEAGDVPGNAAATQNPATAKSRITSDPFMRSRTSERTGCFRGNKKERPGAAYAFAQGGHPGLT